MNLHEALDGVAQQLNLDTGALIGYAAEDEIGGWPNSLPPHADWPGGSIWSVEGKFLYALTRAVQPTNILECGTKWGCSTTHFLSALKANGQGKLTSVDKGVDTDLDGPGYGAGVPAALKSDWTFHFPVSAQDFLDSNATPFDLAYEDTCHLADETKDILARLKAHDSIRVIVSHDIAHPWVGYAMRDAWTKVFGEQGRDWQAYHIEPSDCGLAVWRRP